MAEKVEIWGVRDPNISAQLAIAAKLDLFKRDTGLDVICKFTESGTTMPTDVLHAEKKPFAFTQTPITSILLHDKGLSTKIVAPLADVAGAQQMVIHEESGIAHPQDLEGKLVGMAQGAAILIAIKNMAKDCNVDLNKVEFVDLLPHEQLEEFEKGNIHAVACWEPWTSKARGLAGKFYFSGSRSEIPGMEGDVNWLVNQGCLIIPDEYLNQDPDMVVAILKVFQKATDFINDRRKEVSKILAGFFDLSRVELLSAMNQNTYTMAMDSLFRIGVLGFRDFLYDNKSIASKFSETVLYDTKFLKAVNPSLVKLVDASTLSLQIVEKDKVYYLKDGLLSADKTALKFLLADDSRFVRVSLSQAVKMLGGEVVGEATNGREAIDMFAHLRPNFITMDLSMPGVTGIEAIKEILQIEPSVNIIVISGTDMDEVRQEVFNLGAKAFIAKPFNPQKVATVIDSLIA